jgi:AAA domain
MTTISAAQKEAALRVFEDLGIRSGPAPADVPDAGPPDDDIPPPESLAEYGLSADTEPSNGTEKINTAQSARLVPLSWWRDPATIPPRQSLYDGHYIRRAIGATIGGGGRAKTTRGIYEAVCMAVGFDIATKDILTEGKLRVWVCNGEEDQDELDRRVSATCQHYGITQVELGGRLFVQSVRDNPLRIASLINNRPVIDDGVMKYMTSFITSNSIDVFMLDPLVSFHGVMENDNGHMDLVIKEGFGAIANSTNSAGEMFHHPGKAKPGQADTSVEDGRGASAILWAVRSARVFNFMTPEEAAKLGMAEDDRKLHIRIANGKANMGPLGKAKWMKLVVEDLVNGDHVAVASPWSPPDPFNGMTVRDLFAVQKRISEGVWRESSQSPDWAGRAVAEVLDLDLESAPLQNRIKSLLKTWIESGALKVVSKPDEGRKERKFVEVGQWAT